MPSESIEEEGGWWIQTERTTTNTEQKKRITIKENRTDFSCVCDRKFSSQKGFKIHRTKIGCASQIATQEQRSVNGDKTSENQSQEANHSVEDIQAVGSKDETKPKLPRIRFRLACDSEAWSMLFYAISKTLDKKLGKKKYNRRLNESGLVIYEVCKEILGVKETINKLPAKENRRQRMMKDLRNKKKNLKRQLRLANFDEKEGLLKISQDLKEKHNALSRAKNQRKRRVRRRKEQGHFFQEPYKYAKNIFDKPKSGVLKTEKNLLEKKDMYSDPRWHILLENNSNLVLPAGPKVEFDMKPRTRDEIRRIVSKSRNRSTPVPNGITFLLYR